MQHYYVLYTYMVNTNQKFLNTLRQSVQKVLNTLPQLNTMVLFAKRDRGNGAMIMVPTVVPFALLLLGGEHFHSFSSVVPFAKRDRGALPTEGIFQPSP